MVGAYGKKDYLKIISKDIHRTIVATVDDEGLPVTAAIDMMDSDENGLYFLTAKGKNFYDRLIKRGYLALTAMKGEYFDLSKKPIERVSFAFGGEEKKEQGYFITDACIGCGSCVAVCPQNCIIQDEVPFVIKQENCLHCGNCMTACPTGAVERR